MILLHVTVVALYGLAAYILWPVTAGRGTSSRAGDRLPAGAVRVAASACAHRAMRGLAFQNVVTPEGLDLSFANAVSVVAGLVAAVAWVSGLLATLPAIGTVVLPIAAAASLLPRSS